MAKPLDQLIQKAMDRKEFLRILALAILSIFGFSKIIELLTGHSLNHNVNPHPSSVYGVSRTKVDL